MTNMSKKPKMELVEETEPEPAKPVSIAKPGAFNLDQFKIEEPTQHRRRVHPADRAAASQHRTGQ